MSRLICLWAFGSVFCFQGAVSAELLFERGSEWKFFKGAREPSIAESRWWETEFDDSELAHGHTELNPRPYRCGGASELDFRGEKKWDLRARNPELC